MNERPELLPQNVFYFQSFNILNRQRQCGFGPNPITALDILAFYQIHQVEEIADAQKFFNRIYFLDQIFLEDYAEKEKKKRKKKKHGRH